MKLPVGKSLLRVTANQKDSWRNLRQLKSLKDEVCEWVAAKKNEKAKSDLLALFDGKYLDAMNLIKRQLAEQIDLLSTELDDECRAHEGDAYARFRRWRKEHTLRAWQELRETLLSQHENRWGTI